MTTIQFLEKCLEELHRQEREKEARRLNYETLARKALGQPTRVTFEEIEKFWNGDDVLGKIDLAGDGTYRIRILGGLPLAVEHAVLSHEIVHGLRGDARDATPENQAEAEVAWKIITSKELSAVSPVDIKGIFFKTHNAREQEVHKVAAQLHKLLFPGETYFFK